MENLNVDFLTSGKQFVNKLNKNEVLNNCNNPCVNNSKIAWCAKNVKSENHLQILKQAEKYKDLKK